MPWRLRFDIALRQTFDWGRGLSGFLSRVSIIGLVLAIALLMTVVSVMNGFDREMRERILSLVPHVLIQGPRDAPAWPEVEAGLLNQASVTSLQRFLSADALLIRGQSVESVRLTGVNAQALDAYRSVLSGPIVAWDHRDVVLGQGLAKRLGLEPGDTVALILPESTTGSLDGFVPLSLQVVAMLRSGTELDEQFAMTHIDAIRMATDQAVTTEGLAVQYDDVFSASRHRWDLMQSLPGSLRATDWRASHGNLYSAIQLSRDLVGFVLFSVILVAAFNVVSSLMLVVTDRRKIIAMLMAMGASRRDVMAIFLVQGGVIGILGAAVGGVLGVAIALAMPAVAGWIEGLLGYSLLQTDVYPLAFIPVDIRWEDFLLTALIAVALSILAAVLPAIRAVSVPIASALSH